MNMFVQFSVIWKGVLSLNLSIGLPCEGLYKCSAWFILGEWCPKKKRLVILGVKISFIMQLLLVFRNIKAGVRIDKCKRNVALCHFPWLSADSRTIDVAEHTMCGKSVGGAEQKTSEAMRVSSPEPDSSDVWWGQLDAHKQSWRRANAHPSFGPPKCPPCHANLSLSDPFCDKVEFHCTPCLKMATKY